MDLSFLTNVYISSDKPSYFELTSVAQLREGLQGALNHVGTQLEVRRQFYRTKLRSKLDELESRQCEKETIETEISPPSPKSSFVLLLVVMIRNFLKRLAISAPKLLNKFLNKFLLYLLETGISVSFLLEVILLGAVEGYHLNEYGSGWAEKFFSLKYGLHISTEENFFTTGENFLNKFFTGILKGNYFRNTTSKSTSRSSIENISLKISSLDPGSDPNRHFLRLEQEKLRKNFRLSMSMKALFLIVYVVKPYLVKKWKEGYHVEERKRNSFRTTSTSGVSADHDDTSGVSGVVPLTTFLRNSLLSTYPTYKFLSASLQILYEVTYLLEKQTFWSMFFHKMGLEIIRDFGEANNVKKNTVVLEKNKLFAILKQFLSMLFWTSLYSVQFAQWYYQREKKLQPLEEKRVPSAPVDPVKSKYCILHQDKRICPICSKKRKNPAQSKGGFVYCYPCLMQFVVREGRCPATHWPMRVDQVRKLVVDD